MMNRSDGGVIVLFDGVCNLCNASVRWFIERDHKARLRFASLQSEEGRRALASAGATGELPDSIVVIDSGRVLTRSDAVLAAVRRLGFPWLLLGLFVVLPRAVRDRLYDFVAARRYLWFGKQTACAVPTGDVRGRFLGDEAPVTERAAEASSCGLVAWLHRVLIVYLVAHHFPFPLQLAPYVNAAAGWYSRGMHAVVPWFGRLVFGVEIGNFPGGSGDTLYNYVELAVFGVVAVLVGTLWAVAARGRRISARTRDVLNTWLRYSLAATMLSYGWAKVFVSQMPAPGPDRFIETVGDLSPMGLLWLFIGSSSAYQVFAGLGEVVGGALLLFRRTTLLGSIVVMGVMVHVVAFNFMYDVPVKLFSSHLLLTAVYLMSPHAARLAAVLVLNLPAQPVVLRPLPVRRAWARWVRGLVKTVVVVMLTVYGAWGAYGYAVSAGALAPVKAWHGVYRVESFVLDGVADRSLPDDQRWVRVGLNSGGVGAIQTADGTSRRSGMVLNPKNDTGAATLTISRRGEPTPITLGVEMPGPGEIVLAGDYEGKTIEARLKRIEDYRPLLYSRGFNWVQEFPFNR